MQDPLISPKARNKYSTCTLWVHWRPVDWGIPEPKPSRGDDREKGLRGLEWGAGQCEMDEVDATRHRKVGPSERQSSS